jgi:hypothetical protein
MHLYMHQCYNDTSKWFNLKGDYANEIGYNIGWQNGTAKC